jgi:Ca-activated chloride channel family protein
LRDLLAEVTVSQSYQNQEQKNIEAVYTFPLPLDAVLLDLDIVIGNRHLKGAVVEKRAAETKYEDAVESGDAAVMLEELEPGMYTMNVGNLLPGENVTITFRYSLL